jgi:CMP-N,N'-diacetyllegionaminic acid synthase
MTYCFDLDGTLCTHEGDYNNAKPFLERIDKVNRLYEEGNTIIIDTARGATTGLDWHTTTELQLREWGCKYHTLRVGKKINADIFVDDKGISDSDFFDNNNKN